MKKPMEELRKGLEDQHVVSVSQRDVEAIDSIVGDLGYLVVWGDAPDDWTYVEDYARKIADALVRNGWRPPLSNKPREGA